MSFFQRSLPAGGLLFLVGLLTLIASLAWFAASPGLVSATGAALAAAPSAPLQAGSVYLPLIARPASAANNQKKRLQQLLQQVSLTLPHPLAQESDSWCTWGWCSISPRLYQEPLSDGRTLVGWTDSSGDGHVSMLDAAGSLVQTFDLPALPVHGLAPLDGGQFAVLLWQSGTKTMWLSRRAADGSEAWKTSLKGSLTSFNPNIGDSRLAHGNGTYLAYFAVHGDSGWVMGHEGDQLVYINDAGQIQSGGWDWGCSHSMAELASFHPGLNKFMAACSSDCYAHKGILINDSKVVYPSDGNCGGNVSAQLGQAAALTNSWKLVFNALDRPGIPGKGIGLASIDGSFNSSFAWLTNTTGETERDPVLARLGSSLQSDRLLVGWTTTNNNTYWLGVIDASGSFLAGPEEVSSAGASWGNRDDSLRTRPDGRVSWVQGEPGSSALHWFVFDGSSY